MNPLLPLAVLIQRLLVDLPCQIDDAELAHFPSKGPILAAGNHISSLEVPIMLSHMYPRLVTGMAKTEAWKNPFFWALYKVYRAVPVRRGEADLNAMQLSMQRLKEGYILAVAPEGTRSYDGQMRQAHPGVALLAVRSGAPVQPFAHFGGENLWKNLRRLKRTPFHIRVGNPFKIDLHGERMNKPVSQQIVDEIMYQVAALMPPFYRGYYCHLEQATEKYLSFEPGVDSNLKRAVENGRV
jgi:1-acyl-sn-glycerol-3-phosphate acyltransferase